MIDIHYTDGVATATVSPIEGEPLLETYCRGAAYIIAAGIWGPLKEIRVNLREPSS